MHYICAYICVYGIYLCVWYIFVCMAAHVHLTDFSPRVRVEGSTIYDHLLDSDGTVAQGLPRLAASLEDLKVLDIRLQ